MQYVSCCIINSGVWSFFTAIYGLYTQSDMSNLWNHITNIGNSILIPWLVVGDFNCVLYNADRIGPDNANQNADANFFNAVIQSGLHELKYS